MERFRLTGQPPGGADEPRSALRAAWTTRAQLEQLRAAGPAVALLEELAGERVIAMTGADAAVPDLSAGAWSDFRLRFSYAPKSVPDLASATALLAVRIHASEEDRDDFRRWLDEEHAELQIALPGVTWYLGYEQVGPVHSFLNLWGLADPGAADDAAWVEQRDTPWWRRVGHVTNGSNRGIYRLLA